MPKKVTITQKYGTYKVTPGIWGNVKRDLDLGWAHQRISEHVGIGKTTIAQIKKSRSFEFVAMNKAITNKRRKKTIEGRQEVHTYIKDDSKHTTIIYSMLFIIILTIVGIFFILSRM